MIDFHFLKNRGCVILLMCMFFSGCSTENHPYEKWEVYRGNPQSNAYSSLTQINRNNVDQLQKAWIFHTGDEGAAIECNPIIVDGIMYVTSPALKVMALHAGTGKLIWKFDPFKDREASGVNRGVTYWKGNHSGRILFAAGPYLYALNAHTGALITSFGDQGKVDLRVGLGRNPDKISVQASSPGVIYKNLLILGSSLHEGLGTPPGYVRAYDVRSGKIAWTFHTIPQPGEDGHTTWKSHINKSKGGANDWSGMSLDPRRGWVFLATGSGTPDFYGGDRKGKNLFANSVVALDAETGTMIWYYQIVHHDLWDYDLPAPPNLIRVKHDGKMVDAVAQVTKTGQVFVLDRETGQPLFPVEERSVPASDVNGETAWPTQPFPSKPPAFVRQKYTRQDLPTISQQSRQYAIERLKNVRNEGIFTPPSLQGTVEFPGTRGGAEWNGASFDVKTGILYVNANDIPNIMTLQKISMPAGQKSDLITTGKKLYQLHCASCHGVNRKGQGPYPSLTGVNTKYSQADVLKQIKNGKGQMPAFASLNEEDRNAIVHYLFELGNPDSKNSSDDKAAIDQDSAYSFTNTGYAQFRDPQGYPAVKPPWGTLNAINLNTGTMLWQVPLGEFKALSKQGIPPTGTQNFGGTLVTAGGLVFVGASKDEKFRAFDKKTGDILWETTLPAGGYATPSTYEMNGKQYVVIAAGGGGKNATPKGNAYVAFSLPK